MLYIRVDAPRIDRSLLDGALQSECVSVFQKNSSIVCEWQHRVHTLPIGMAGFVEYDIEIIALPWVVSNSEIRHNSLR